jgi:transglutaminase-like putative cysteine protease
MVKFPDSAFEYLEQNGLLSNIVYYVINHKNIRDSIWLKPWIKNQVIDSENDLEIQAIVESILKDVKDKKNYDTIAIECLRYVQRRLRYVGDIVTQSTPEYWQTYRETLDTWRGDCEDGAILIYVLCRACGIPANRLILLAGDVQGGGHCWLAYKPSNQPWNLAFLDWCYWYDQTQLPQRKVFWIVNKKINGSDPRYFNMWWCFNENNTYIKFKSTVK